jgi:hypothetical protein
MYIQHLAFATILSLAVSAAAQRDDYYGLYSREAYAEAE